MNKIKLEGIVKNFHNKTVLKGINFSVKEGELLTLLGPSGCGKSTTLKIIAGLVEQDSGKVFIDEKLADNIPVEKRGTVIAFQENLLFPHLTVRQNIGFGLKMRGESKTYIKEKVDRIAGRLNIEDIVDKYPSEISGGQKQRVSIGRALAVDPKVLLLDEPFSSLDINIRNSMRDMLLSIKNEFNITAILVTHDKEEAMMLSDKIALMIDGNIIQYGIPKEIYEKPKCKKAADFFGERNYIKGKVENGVFHSYLMSINAEDYKDGQYEIMIKPEEVKLSKEILKEECKILHKKYAGDRIYYSIEYKDKTLYSLVGSKLNFETEERVGISFEIENLILFN